MRVGPVGITNGAFGNRPHCIYRGFCLQGCKVNAKASPLVTHIPDAIEHGVEIRANCMVSQVCVDDASGRVTGVEYFDRNSSSGGPGAGDGGSGRAGPSDADADRGQETFQRAKAVAVAGYSIETPRLLLNSQSRRFPHGLANNNDQVGRYVMVQGASQVAGRYPMELRMYKAPPPEISSEQFYETDPERGFARGFSIQTVGPLPIGWAEHVLADGHWGGALREYMRDYNHWYTLGVLCELLPQPENRVTTVADVTDRHGLPVARMDYSQCENDRRNIAYATETLRRILEASGAQDTLKIDRYAHLVGGCRMGSDPEESVVNADHRAWEVPNLFIADGSVMPTQGSANPALTIMALASRLAKRLDSARVSDSAGRARLLRPRLFRPPDRVRSAAGAG
jgi:choline dehydrogenase-like flavoprotein